MSGLLSGVTVVDLTRVLAGPYCTMVLADLGARVIKVEQPVKGDDARHYPPFVNDRSAYFMSLNRGKESIALDLKDGADRETFERLLASADVLVENFRGGTLERLGYGWEKLHPLFPRLILASCSGFGDTGPYKERPAYDMVVQAMGGIMSLTGHPGGPPARVGTSVGDITAGLFTAVGIAAALHRRGESGEGSRIDVAMLDCQLAILENAIARYTATGEVPGPLGARHPSIAPFEAYRTADDPIIVAAGNDLLFARLCKAIGRPELIEDPRFRTNRDRVDHVDALGEAVGVALLERPRATWLELLQAGGVPCGPINDVAEVMADPQILSRNMVVESDHPIAGRQRMAGNPIKVTGIEDPGDRPPAPELDQDRAAILASLTRRG
jgi:CoA:oxalate CoA-transferase